MSLEMENFSMYSLMSIRISEASLSKSSTDFSSLGIDPKLLEAIDALGFQSPTDVQDMFYEQAY